MRPADLVLSLILSAVVLGLFVFCYHKVFAVTFDENFARATGVRVDFYHGLIAILRGRMCEKPAEKKES